MSEKVTVVACKYDEEEFQKMKQVLDICNNAGVTIPPEVQEYFGDDEYTENETSELPLTETEDGYELLVEDIPQKFYKIKILKPNNSFELNGNKI